MTATITINSEDVVVSQMTNSDQACSDLIQSIESSVTGSPTLWSQSQIKYSQNAADTNALLNCLAMPYMQSGGL